MKNFKLGFTVSELLLGLGIIAIVSAMGMTVAQKGTEDAYKTYFATGTMNLNNALAQIESGGVNVVVNGNNLQQLVNNNGIFIQGDPDTIFGNIKLITENLKFLFDDTQTYGNGQNQSTDVQATNGIRYNIDSTNNGQRIQITMIVPAPKTRANQNGTATAMFIYDRNQNGLNNRMLIPIAGGNVNLQNRRDLLLTYLDDGFVGRHTGNGYAPIQYGTYEEAFCTLLDSSPVAQRAALNPTNINCNNVARIRRNSNLETGVIKFVSPRKLK